MYLADQVYPEDSLGIYNVYFDAKQEAYGYLLLDLTQNTNDGVRQTYSRMIHLHSPSIRM